MADAPKVIAAGTIPPPPPVPVPLRRDAAPAAATATAPVTNATVAAATDTREPAVKARAEATAAKLTGQCVRDVGGTTLLTPPGRAAQTPAAEVARPDAGANACSTLAPVLAGINAAQDTPLAPGDVGAATAVDRVANSTVTAETERLLAQRNTRTAMIVPGNYDAAIAAVDARLRDSNAVLSRQYPAMAALQKRFFEELVAKSGDRPIDVAALTEAARRLTARAIVSMNGIQPGTNVAGERTIAFPNAEARLAMIPAIVEQVASNPSLLPPDVAQWVRENVGQFTDRAQAIRQVQRAMHNTLEAGAITELIASGRLPVNLTPQEYVAELAKIRGEAVAELRAARPWSSPQERAQNLAVIEQGAAEAERGERPPALTHEQYREIGARAAELTLRGEAHATVLTITVEGRRTVEAVTAQNYQYALTERRADSSTTVGPEQLAAGNHFVAAGEARRRERDEQALRPGSAARQTAALVREVAEADRRNVNAARTEAQNRRTSFVNLRDPGNLTLAAFAARSGNRVS